MRVVTTEKRHAPVSNRRPHELASHLTPAPTMLLERPRPLSADPSRHHDAFVLYRAGHVFVVNDDGTLFTATAREACEMPNFSDGRLKPEREMTPIFSKARHKTFVMIDV